MKKKTLFLAAAVGVCAWALSATKKRYLKCRVMPMEDPVEPQEELLVFLRAMKHFVKSAFTTIARNPNANQRRPLAVT